MVRILGVDPSLRCTGWGLIESSAGGRLSFIASGTISPATNVDLVYRLHSLYTGLEQVISSYLPDQAAMEETFLNKNAMSSLKLGHARGALMVAVSNAKLPFAEYAARLVKKSVVGVGNAEKEQVMVMMKHLLPSADIDGYDESDALAVAICHSSHMTMHQYS